MSIDSKREKFKSSFKAKKYNNAFKLLTSLNYVEIEERKNKMLLIVLISLTLLATIFLGRINPLYFIFPAVYFLLIMFRNKSAKQKVLLFCIYLLYGFIVILIIEFVVLSYILKEPPNNLDSFLFSSFFLFFAFIPLKIIERHIGKVKTIALKQKEYYDIPD